MSDSQKIALRFAGFYAVIGLTWILVSDRLVGLLPSALVTAVQSLKGFLFIVFTAVAVYLLVERLSDRLATEAIRSSSVERLLGQVVSTVPVGVLLTSDDGTISFANNAAEELLGMTAEEAIGRGIDQVCCADSTESMAIIAELMRTGAVDGIPLRRQPGKVARRALARAAEIDPSVPASGWVIAIADMTEAHQARAASERLVAGYQFLTLAVDACLRSPNERSMLRRIAETAVESGRYKAAWAVMWDQEAGHMVDVSTMGMGPRSTETAAMMRELADKTHRSMSADIDGMSVSNDLARDPANVWHPASLEEDFASCASIWIHAAGEVVGGLTLFSAQVGTFDSSEVELLTKLRDAASFTVSRMLLELNRLQLEQQTERTELGYRMMFENSPAPMWIYDIESLAFLAVNDAALAKYGFSRREFLDLTIADIRPEHELARFRDHKLAVSGFGDAGIWTHLDKNGREFPVHVYAHSIDWDGREAKMVMAMEVARIE